MGHTPPEYDRKPPNLYVLRLGRGLPSVESSLSVYPFITNCSIKSFMSFFPPVTGSTPSVPQELLSSSSIRSRPILLHCLDLVWNTIHELFVLGQIRSLLGHSFHEVGRRITFTSLTPSLPMDTQVPVCLSLVVSVVRLTLHSDFECER